MTQSGKETYTDKQKRQAEHIEEGYEKRGVSHNEAESRAWATVNKQSGGGKKSGSGKASEESSSSRKSGKDVYKSASSEARAEAAKKGWETRRKNAKNKKR